MNTALDQRMMAAASEPGVERMIFGASALNAVAGMVLPERLLVTATVLDQDAFLRFALIAAAGSVAGGIGGYVLGYLSWLMVAPWVVNSGWSDQLAMAQQWYHTFGGVVVGAIGLSPLPFSAVAGLSGFLTGSLWQFVAASVVARAARFVLMGWFVWRSGPASKDWLERNFYGLTMALAVAVMIAALLVKYVMSAM